MSSLYVCARGIPPHRNQGVEINSPKGMLTVGGDLFFVAERIFGNKVRSRCLQPGFYKPNPQFYPLPEDGLTKIERAL